MITKAKPQDIDVNRPDFIQSIKRLEANAWTQLYKQIQGKLDAFFRNTLSSCDEDEIDTYIIEVFNRAYTDVHTYQGQSSLDSWMMNLARRVAHNPSRVVGPQDGAPSRRSEGLSTRTEVLNHFLGNVP